MDSSVIFTILAATGWTLAYLAAKKAWTYRRLVADVAEDAGKSERKAAKAQQELTRREGSLGRAEGALANARRERDDLLASAEALRCDLERAQRLSQERFDLIEGVIEEKQLIWRMYRDSSRQAGAAQNWLMREYAAALQALNICRHKAGEAPVEVPKQLEALLADFGVRVAGIPDQPTGTVPGAGSSVPSPDGVPSDTAPGATYPENGTCRETHR